VLIGNNDLTVAPLTWPATYSWHRGVVNFTENPRQNVDISVDLWGKAGTPATIVDAAHNLLDPNHGVMLKDMASPVMAVCYSFGPQKEAPSFMGGMVIFKYASEAAMARRFLTCGTVDRQWQGIKGRKGLMPDPVGAMVKAQISRLRDTRNKRTRLLKEYHRCLGDWLFTKPNECSAHLCVWEAQSKAHRDKVRKRLNSQRVAWGHHYPVPDCVRGYYRDLSDTVITLPLHMGMTVNDVRDICKCVLSVEPPDLQ